MPACPLDNFVGNAASGTFEVHDVFEPSTNAWQYIIMDRATRSCVLVDPVLDSTHDRLTMSTHAADKLLSLVKDRSYRVDMILETLSSPTDTRSAAWYLRSQLLKIQGHAPRVCGAQAAQPFGNLFQRKYGFSPKDTLTEEFVDGDSVHVGQIKITMLSLPGLHTPDGRAYMIEGNVFGAHSIANLRSKMQEPGALQTAGADGIHRAWTSMQKVLGMPGQNKLYFDQGSGPVLAVGRKVRFDANDESEEQGRPFSTVTECRPSSEEIRAMAQETEALLDADSGFTASPSNMKSQQNAEKPEKKKGGFFSRSRKS